MQSNDFPFSFVRSMQFFWGPTLIIPMLLGLFRLARPADPRQLAQQFIKALCIIAASITLLEVLLVALGVSPDAIPWVTNVYKGPHRPFGLPAYPQPNAVFLALLFWLSFLWEVPGKFHRILTFVALGLTFGGTGQVTFLALLPLWTRKPILFFFVALVALGILMGGATITEQHSGRGLFEKFDLAYLGILATVFINVASSLLSQFSNANLLMGSSFISGAATTGLTHDWAYFDVFYVHGLIGLVGYILLYGTIVYVACPRETSRQMRIYFMMVVMCANFHYGTLNYYVGQMLFSCLAALGIYRLYPIRQKRSEPAPQIATVTP
jgi:hypothetical protein